MNRFLTVLCSLFFAACLQATELTDLGQGLSYLRIHSVADSELALRKSVPGAGALVLDLRYATGDETSVTALRSALQGRPANDLLFVLVSPSTPPAVTPVLAASNALVLGAPNSVPAPKVIVRTDAAADRRAYDALDAGTELSKLISGKIEKERFDEATLVREFRAGNHDAEPPETPDPTLAKEEPASKPETKAEKNADAKTTPSAPPTDRVLQRAVHLHRALLALKAR